MSIIECQHKSVVLHNIKPHKALGDTARVGINSCWLIKKVKDALFKMQGSINPKENGCNSA